ncbi:hypothetical protein [Streptomyces marokkonensis]|uniref:hypothetical protein n=1 Tax=Streptomyces marokkonensis TaxID=324855 RepID=UPI0011F2DF73|nr:hypothetical protein [Streptomyces marokkonensis]
MTHTDPSHLPPASRRGTAPGGGGGVGHTLPRVVLVISVVGNTVASYTGTGVGVHLAAGVVTAVCATLLVVLRLRSGR